MVDPEGKAANLTQCRFLIRRHGFNEVRGTKFDAAQQKSFIDFKKDSENTTKQVEV